jgi:hypothetical protein
MLRREGTLTLFMPARRVCRHTGIGLQEERVAIRAVMFDFGGVISTSPFDAFARLEIEHGLPPGFIRTVNATNPHNNAWARLERGELGVDAFGSEWATEAHSLGHEVDGRLVLERLGGEIRPQMVRRPHSSSHRGTPTPRAPRRAWRRRVQCRPRITCPRTPFRQKSSRRPSTPIEAGIGS